jgi:hypothetical protein
MMGTPGVPKNTVFFGMRTPCSRVILTDVLLVGSGKIRPVKYSKQGTPGKIPDRDSGPETPGAILPAWDSVRKIPDGTPGRNTFAL